MVRGSTVLISINFFPYCPYYSYLSTLLQGGSQDQATNTAESVNSNLRHGELVSAR